MDLCKWFSITSYVYPGFFVDINLFKANKERDSEIARNNNLEKTVSGNGGVSGTDGLANEDENLMIKLKFLTYKVRLLPEIEHKITAFKGWRLLWFVRLSFYLMEMDYLLKNYAY